jgi:hypothetical protein
MKKISLAFVLILSLVIAGNASATCTFTTYGPYVWAWIEWYVYDMSQDCYTLSSNVSSQNGSCNYGPGWSFGGGWSETATASFTIDSSVPVIDPTKWTVSSFIEAYSPSADWYDQIEIDVIVHHPNNTNSYYQPFYWNGTMTTLNGCQQQYGFFSADTGDVVTIQIKTTNLTGATLKATVPGIQNSN